MNKGFTLIEIIITIAIVATLSGIILFSVIHYIDKGKDSNIYGNLAILPLAGEAYYNGANSYEGFCGSNVVTNAWQQMPPDTVNQNCNVASDGDSWAACVTRFTDDTMAYCVDSRGVKREIDNDNCKIGITECSSSI